MTRPTRSSPSSSAPSGRSSSSPRGRSMMPGLYPPRRRSRSGRRAAPTVRVGSKTFTESVILGEIARGLIQRAGIPALASPRAGRDPGPLSRPRVRRARRLSRIHRHDLGRDPGGQGNPRTKTRLRAALAERGVGMSRPLGFNDTYAIGMREDVAARLGIASLSDLQTPSRAQVRVQQRIHGSGRRLARPARPLRASPARRPRARPRPRLSRTGRGRDPGHRPLLDRRRDPAVQACACSATT